MIVITDSNFEQEVLKSDIPVLIDFWAEWCAPCKMIEGTVEELANQYAGKIKVGKLNVDDNSLTAARLGIRSIPTLMFFKNGEKADMLIGAHPKNNIEKKILSVID